MRYRTFALIVVAIALTFGFIGVWSIYTANTPTTSNNTKTTNLESVVVNKDSPYTFNFNYSTSRVVLNESQDLSVFLNSESSEFFRGAEVLITYDTSKIKIDSIAGSPGSFDVYADPLDNTGTIKVAGVTTEDKVLNFGVEILRIQFTKIASGSTEIKILGGENNSKVVDDSFEAFETNETILTVSD
jgi:hypothetical protein